MTLRRKTLLIVGVGLGVLFVVVYLIVSFISISGFTTVENQDTHQNVSRALQALDDEIGKLSTNVIDWASWDDTYQFMVDHNQPYIDDNLDSSTLDYLKLNLILYVDNAHEIVFAEGYNLENREAAPLPNGLADYLTQNPLLLTHADTTSSHAGFINVSEQIILVASRPVLTSDDQGPIHGTLIMGRYLDNSLIRELSERTHLTLNFDRLPSSSPSPNFQQALDALSGSESGEPFVQILNAETIAGYSILRDVDGQPQLMMRVEMPRTVFAQATSSQIYLAIAMLIVGGLTVTLILFILERLVLLRLARLSQEVTTIGATGDISCRLALPGSDELSRLSGTINKMLDDLQAGLHREKNLEAKVEFLEIQIDLAKRDKQVEEITESDYFRDLQKKAKHMRKITESADA